MTKQLFTIAILFCCMHLHAQTWQWANKADGSGGDEIATATATDASGNVYVVGDFTSASVTFGGTTLTNSGMTDFFIVKYDTWGALAWAKKIGGTKDDLVNGICIDMNGNILITGEFVSNVLSFGTVSLSVTSANLSDIFVAKLDPSGTVLWAKKGTGTGDDSAIGVCTDATGNVIIAGSFNSPTIAFGPTAITKAGSVDVLIAKFDANGNYLWAQNSGGANSDGEAYGVATDGAGNIFVAGFFQSSSISFGTNALANAGSSDIFIAKYSVSGIPFWAKSAGGTDEDQVLGICTDMTGNAFITGYFFSNAITFGANTISNTNVGTEDIFVAKYDGSGTAAWSKGVGSLSGDEGRSIACDAAGNVYIAGYFHSSVTFGSTTLTSSGNEDIFLARYSPSGTPGYAKGAGGTGHDIATAIGIDLSNNAYIAGGFLSPTFPLGGTTLVNADLGDSISDMFVAKLNSVNAIDDGKELSVVTMFPNPTRGEFTINIPMGFNEVQIISADGRLVQSKNIRGEVNPDFEVIENGVYFIRIIKDDTIITKKLIVNN